MERINGFIDLDKLLDLPKKESKEVLESIENLYKRTSGKKNLVFTKIRKDTKQFIIKFEYNNETYYFKYDPTSSPYNELIMEEIAKDMGVENIRYDLATIGGFKGVISKDFKIEGAKYISGTKIINDLYDDENGNLIDKKNLPFTYNDKSTYFHTLEGVWASLEYRYNEGEIVKNLMQKIVNLFVFKILIGDEDFHSDNWMVLEYPNGDVDLAFNFDNARAMLKNPYETEVGMHTSNYEDKYLDTNLDYFRDISSSEFQGLFEKNIRFLSEENLLSIFKRVEEKIGCLLPQKVKDNYLLKFAIYRDFFEEENNLKI